MRKHILITGNMGYVGSVLVPFLRHHYTNIHITGYDIGYFGSNLSSDDILPESRIDNQIFGDIREVSNDVLHGVDSIIHLAAISNDPIGSRFEAVTEDVNEHATLRLARAAAKQGVQSFVFASSCSVYGLASMHARTEQDSVNPLTAYARSKVAAEHGLTSHDHGDMLITSLRFATACGASPRLRLDLVLNDFVMNAVFHKRIVIHSNGTPWRPLIDVEDMARALAFGAFRPFNSALRNLILNAGTNDANYQVIDLAHAVARRVGNVEISVNTAAPDDVRSYRVDFSKFRSIAPEFTPVLSLEMTIDRLRDSLAQQRVLNTELFISRMKRLPVLESLLKEGLLTPQLQWAKSTVESRPG
jgi:nucleoside-diphosphate-sugar epimerase